MHRPFIQRLRWLAAPLLAAALPALAQLPVVFGEPVQAPKTLQAAPQLRIEAQVRARPQLRAKAVLAAPTAAELAVVLPANAPQGSKAALKRVAIGVVRTLEATPALPSAADLQWLPVDGGYAAQMAVASPTAAALRVSFDLAAAPPELQMVFFGSDDPTRLVGPVRVGELAQRAVPWWSPLTEGDTQVVEFFYPGAANPASLRFGALRVTHLVTGPSRGFSKASFGCAGTTGIGCAGSCNVDLPCSSLSANSAFVNAANGVAQMVFNDGPTAFLCTGTLLNDTDASTQIPWFFSANHCFDNVDPPYKTPAQMQAVANTLQTLWFFQSSACNSGQASSAYRQIFGGATYVYNDATSDVLFLRLNSTPPAGAFFAGWDPNPIATGAAVVDAHHPMGDLKKVSQGNVLGFTTPPDPPVSSGTNRFVGIQWSSGTTEGGSSGSPMLTSGQFAGQAQYLVRGALWGGFASCDTPSGEDMFSRLDQAYPALAPYLAPANAPAADYSDLWFNADESGSGLSIVQHPSHIIFAAWFTYGGDGKVTWYVIPKGSWTSSTTYTGALYTAAGSAANGPFDPSQLVAIPVGSATLSFSDASHGTLSYSINGTTGVKSITRQLF